MPYPLDRNSTTLYKEGYKRLTKKHGEVTAQALMPSFIESSVNDRVRGQKEKRFADVCIVVTSTTCSTAVPFLGVPVVVFAVIMRCLTFAAELGLIPLANVSSLGDVHEQFVRNIETAVVNGSKGGLEAVILELFKNAGIDTWIWEEILKDVLLEFIGDAVTSSSWVMTPLFVVPKYMLHRHLVKKMYSSLGKKAIKVHQQWALSELYA